MTVIYGSNVLSLVAPTTACQMSTATGGTETSATSTPTGSSAYFEVASRTSSIASVAAIPAPTGNGWVYAPGGGTFATGNWSAAIALSTTFSGALSGTLTFRVFKYSSGVYTAIGTIVLTNPTLSTTRAVVSFTATSMSSVAMGTSDLVYFDLWFNDTPNVAGDDCVVYESNSGSVGVANDMQVTTSTFTPGSPSRAIPATAALSLAGVTQTTVSTSTVVYATRQQTGQRTFIASDGTACVLWVDGTNQVHLVCLFPLFLMDKGNHSENWRADGSCGQVSRCY